MIFNPWHFALKK